MTIGRPTKLTPKLQEEIVQVIRAGNYVETACSFVGINKTTFYDWLKRGAREQARLEKDSSAKIDPQERIYLNFSNAIKKAEAEAEARDVIIIGKAAEHQWQAAAWRLERKFPSKWGRRTDLDDDEQRARINKLKAEIKLLQTEPGDQESIKEFVDTIKPDKNALNKLFEDKQDGEI